MNWFFSKKSIKSSAINFCRRKSSKSSKRYSMASSSVALHFLGPKWTKRFKWNKKNKDKWSKKYSDAWKLHGTTKRWKKKFSFTTFQRFSHILLAWWRPKSKLHATNALHSTVQIWKRGILRIWSKESITCSRKECRETMLHGIMVLGCSGGFLRRGKIDCRTRTGT